jgi:hypothetical protein
MDGIQFVLIMDMISVRFKVKAFWECFSWRFVFISRD